ncbi:hypothetical protein IAT38_005913 [Cryptococcus sp. DSM 104549]
MRPRGFHGNAMDFFRQSAQKDSVAHGLGYFDSGDEYHDYSDEDDGFDDDYGDYSDDNSSPAPEIPDRIDLDKRNVAEYFCGLGGEFGTGRAIKEKGGKGKGKAAKRKSSESLGDPSSLEAKLKELDKHQVSPHVALGSKNSTPVLFPNATIISLEKEVMEEANEHPEKWAGILMPGLKMMMHGDEGWKEDATHHHLCITLPDEAISPVLAQSMRPWAWFLTLHNVRPHELLAGVLTAPFITIFINGMEEKKETHGMEQSPMEISVIEYIAGVFDNDDYRRKIKQINHKKESGDTNAVVDEEVPTVQGITMYNWEDPEVNEDDQMDMIISLPDGSTGGAWYDWLNENVGWLLWLDTGKCKACGGKH